MVVGYVKVKSGFVFFVLCVVDSDDGGFDV